MHSESDDGCGNCATRQTVSGNRHSVLVDCAVEGKQARGMEKSVGDCVNDIFYTSSLPPTFEDVKFQHP